MAAAIDRCEVAVMSRPSVDAITVVFSWLGFVEFASSAVFAWVSITRSGCLGFAKDTGEWVARIK